MHKVIEHDIHEDHLEWDDDTEAKEEDMTQMAKCLITLIAGAIIVACTILYFLIF